MIAWRFWILSFNPMFEVVKEYKILPSYSWKTNPPFVKLTLYTIFKKYKIKVINLQT